MNTRFNWIPKTYAALCLALLTLGLLGCNASIFAPQTAALGGLQYDPMVQSNAERAQKSAEFAQQQTCPAATGYRNMSQFKADEAQATADLSAELAQGIRDALEQRAKIKGFTDLAEQRFATSKTALQEAFARYTAVTSQGDQARLRDLIPAITDLQDAAQQYGRDMLHVADEFRDLAQNPDNAGLLDGVMDDPVATAIDFQAKAEQMLGNIQLAGNTEYSVPENPRSREAYDNPDDWVPYNPQLRLRDFKVPSGLRQNEFDFTDEYDSIVTVMGLMNDMGGILVGDEEFRRDPAQKAFTTIQQTMTDAAEGLLTKMTTNTKTISELTDQSHALAAEATRQAWLAHQACGGELPPDFPDVENPFDNRPTNIPGWSSTFWDISSP